MNSLFSLFTGKRAQALYWSTGMMALAYLLDGIINLLAGANLPNEVTTLIGLILAQISKHLRNLIVKP